MAMFRWGQPDDDWPRYAKQHLDRIQARADEESGVPIRDMDLTPSKVWQTEPPQAVCFPGLVRSVLDVQHELMLLRRKSLWGLLTEPNTIGPLGGFIDREQRDKRHAMWQSLYNQQWNQDEPRRPARINRFV